MRNHFDAASTARQSIPESRGDSGARRKVGLAGVLAGGRGAMARADIIGLTLISSVLIAFMAASLGGRDLPTVGSISAGKLLLLSVGSGAIAFVVVSVSLLLWHGRQLHQAAHAATAEMLELRKSLRAADTILRAEPQVRLYWEEGAIARLMVNNLEGIAGLPRGAEDILRIGAWLEPDAAAELKAGLDQLFTDGRPFNLLLRTRAGAHLEADGRTAGSRAILKLRDIAGQKRDLARIVDQHRRLGREIKAARVLLDALPMPVWVNQAYARAVDLETPAEVTGRQVELLESRQRKDIDATLGRGVAHRGRVRLIVGGERRSFDVVALPLEHTSAGLAIDVGALEKAEGELSRQSALHEGMLDRVSTGVAIFGPDRKLGFFNAAFHQLWKLDSDWLSSRPADGEILDRLREQRELPEMANYRDFRTKSLARYGAPADKGTEAEQLDWWHLPDGRTIRVTVVPRPDGGLTYLYDDVTEEFALKRRYELMIHVQKETLDHLKEAVALFATDGRLKLYNPAFAQLWQLEAKPLEQEPHIDEVVRLMQRLHMDDVTWRDVKRAVTDLNGSRRPLNGKLQRSDGCSIDYALLPLPDGATLLSFADVTAVKRMERVLTERNEALVAADKLKNRFISHVSYELRTPLQTITGFSELMLSPRTGLLTPRQRDYMSTVVTASEALKSVINGILDLAIIDAGALELNLAPIKVATLIEEASGAVRDRLTRANLKFEVSVARSVNELVGDANRLRQVLDNLLSNAIGFSEPGKTVRLTCHKVGDDVMVSIEDEGVGIAKDELPRIFERFVSRTQGSSHRGAGLGLPLVKSLVELHGGTVWIDSDLGKGTRVHLKLPERGRVKVGGARVVKDVLDAAAGTGDQIAPIT
jgi:signal transduction histidine kinase